MDLKRFFFESMNELSIAFTDKQYEQFMLYKELLLSWNEKINLTSITEEKEIIQKHFIDSVSLLSVCQLEENCHVIDVGTGAGFPGLPLKIMRPDCKLTLLDSLNKRILFLEEVIGSLALKDVTCIHARAEEAGQKIAYREKFDYCVSRAVANLSTLCEYCLPFVRVGGYFLSLKGPGVDKEIMESKMAIERLGGSLEDIKPITIPFSDLKHTLVVIRKNRQTPTCYPRKPGKALKNPISS